MTKQQKYLNSFCDCVLVKLFAETLGNIKRNVLNASWGCTAQRDGLAGWPQSETFGAAIYTQTLWRLENFTHCLTFRRKATKKIEKPLRKHTWQWDTHC